MAACFTPQSVKAHLATSVPCCVTPRRIVLRFVAYWHVALAVLVLRLGRYDKLVFEEHTSFLPHTADVRVGQRAETLWGVALIWRRAWLTVVVVPAAGVNLEILKNRRMFFDLQETRRGETPGGAHDASKQKHAGAKRSGRPATVPHGTGTDNVPTIARVESETRQRSPSENERATSPAAADERVAGPAALISVDTKDIIVQPPAESWICRNTVGHGPCWWREGDGIPKGRSCLSSECCSNTYCKVLGQCGGWCINSGALCVVKNAEYSYGYCSCKNYLKSCHADAHCRDRPDPLGGAFCQCHEGFYGDGKTCKPDPCHVKPCTPGDCHRASDDSGGYICKCPDNYELDTTGKQQACRPKPNVCLTKPCGADALECVAFDDKYECLCNDGYIYKEAGSTCVKVDLCTGDPCGPAEAVDACLATRLDYTCLCREGYAVVTTDEGTERCQKDPCKDNPCGPPELVESCRIQTDDSNEITGYKCLCTDIASLKEDSKSGSSVCTLRDLCLDDPCGSPQSTAMCYMEGYRYRCKCQPGYSAIVRKGKVQCIYGDPCSAGACGDPALVENCLTNGNAYSCTCVEGKGFLSRRSEDDIEYCENLVVCRKRCGGTLGLESCHLDKDGNPDCKCGAGYLPSNRKKGEPCVEGTVCSSAPCGGPEAVLECHPRGVDAYSCVCHKGFVLRHVSDKEVCVAPNSCVGDPCGDADAVVDCVEGPKTYKCTCATDFVFERDPAGGKCVPKRNTKSSSAEKKETSQKKTKKEGDQRSFWTLTACAGAGVLLLVLLGSGVFFKKSSRREDDDSGEAETFYVPGQAARGGQPAGG